jgi:hypothetical protein
MEDVKTEVTEEVEEDVVEETAEAEDDGLEYDDDGRLLIPDDEEEDPTEEEGDTTPQDAPDEKEVRIAELEKELARMRTASARALKKLGYEDTDPATALERMAAEVDGKSIDEYRADVAREQEEAENAELIREAKYARLKADDFSEIIAAIPEAAKYKKVEEFPHFRRFAELRVQGLTPVEAFSATHGDVLAEAGARSRKAVQDSKTHLRSTARGGARGGSLGITSAQMATFREMFPDLTDRQIVEKYKNATRK